MRENREKKLAEMSLLEKKEEKMRRSRVNGQRSGRALRRREAT
jgi:hypothetical protein